MSTQTNEDRNEKTLNRREFFQRAAVLGVMAAGAGSLLAACKDQGADGGAAPSGGESAGAEAAGGDFSCMDTEGLDETAIGLRESMQYVDETPKSDQDCDNCLHYKEPESGSGCGGCAVIPGPIHPDGWCTAWVAQA